MKQKRKDIFSESATKLLLQKRNKFNYESANSLGSGYAVLLTVILNVCDGGDRV